MYRRVKTRQRQQAPRQSQVVKFDSPVAGWISNRSLSNPQDLNGQSGAAVLDNFFPTATGALLRRGKVLYATLGDGTKDVTSIFSYMNGENRRLFATTEDTLYDLTRVNFPDNLFLVTEKEDFLVTEKGEFLGELSTDPFDDVRNYTGGNWVVVQFATSGNVYLVGVNGQDEGFIFDGENFYPYIKGGVWRINDKNRQGEWQIGDKVTDSRTGATGTISAITDDFILVTGVDYEPTRWTLTFKDGSPRFTVGGTIVGKNSKAYATIVEIEDNVRRTLRFTMLSGGEATEIPIGSIVNGDKSGASGKVVSVNYDTDSEYTFKVKNITAPFAVGEKVSNASGTSGTFLRIENSFQYWNLKYTKGDTAFQEGEVVIGATSGARATVSFLEESDASYLAIFNYTGFFTEGEQLSGDRGGQGTVAAVTGAPVIGGDMFLTNIVPADQIFHTGDDLTGDRGGRGVVRTDQTGPFKAGEMTLTDIEETFQNGEMLTIVSSDGTITLTAQAASSLNNETYDGTLYLEGLNGQFDIGEEIRQGTAASATTTSIAEYSSGGAFLDGDQITGDPSGTTSTVDGDAEQLVPGIEFPDDLTSADMSYVWAYQNRLWFIQKHSLNLYYMDQPDSIGGTLVKYPLGGILGKGGEVMWGAEWSLEAGASGGLSSQLVACSSEGEAVIFQGFSPEDSTWNQVGVYQVGKPLGYRAHFRGGGDIAVATVSGLVPLSKAIGLDVSAMSQATISYNIQDEWQRAVEYRGLSDWVCGLWPERKVAVISPPLEIGSTEAVLFISNTETGAWCRFTNWNIRCMDVFNSQLYFGGPNGQVFLANVSGYDHEESYSGMYVPLFNDFGSPSNLKVPKVGRAVTRASVKTIYTLEFVSDFITEDGAAPSASFISGGSIWGEGIWGETRWGSIQDRIVTQDWKSLGGSGYACSLNYQVTSGSNAPLDLQIIRMEMTYTVGEVVS